MCTLILGLGVGGPGTVLVGANRDEDPARASDPPRVLSREPALAGGRDRRAGGTWLAVRERRAVVAMLNRRPSRDDLGRSWPRSRGLLTLAVAGASEADDGDATGLPIEVPAGLARAALACAWRAVTGEDYAPFSLVFASPGSAWLVARASGGRPFARVVEPGWHVLTHAELDDPREPRAAYLARALAGFAPGTAAEAAIAVMARLRSHGGDSPAVCLHSGRMVTVSSSLVWLAPGAARYAHAEGRPCENPYLDSSPLLAGRTHGGPE